jgi:hypothetical protein
VPAPEPPREEPREPRRGKSVETLRRNLRDIAEALGPRDLDTLTAFAEFLKSRRAARSFNQHFADATVSAEDEVPASQEIPNNARSDTA